MRLDPYEGFGLPRDANSQAIKRAYRDQAKRAHPDAGGDRARFERLKRASLVLLSPERRRRYDETGEIDEGAVINRDEEDALQQIGSLLNILLGQGEQVFGEDLIEVMKRNFTQGIAKIAEQQKIVPARIARAEKLRGRFTRTKPGDNVLARMIDGQIEMMRQGLALGERQRKSMLRAIEIIDDYRFERDRDSDVFSYRPNYLGQTATGTW